MPKIAPSREVSGVEQILSQPLGEANSVDTLLSDFKPPELWGNEFLLFKPVCGTLLQEPQQTNTVFKELNTMPGT